MNNRKSRKVMRTGKTFDTYAIDKLIGQGGFSDVYEVHNIVTNEVYAMKL